MSEYFDATGRRKAAVARVRLIPGEGNATVNNRPLREYFVRDTLVHAVQQPLALTQNLGKFDVIAKVKGGGISGQAEAVRHGIAKALLQVDAGLRKVLRGAGLLTRDARVKERKKYGMAGARKRYQFSKR